MSGLYYVAAVVVGLCLAAIAVWFADSYVVMLKRWEQAALAWVVFVLVVAIAVQVKP